MTPEQYAALEPNKVLLTMRIIAGALMAGVVSFGGVVAMTVINGQPQQGQQVAGNANPILYIGIVFATLAVIARFVVPSLIAKHMVAGIVKLANSGMATGSKELFGRLLTVAQTKMIIEDALLEGACFCNLIAVMITRSMISVGLVAGLFVLMALNFPTMGKLAGFIEEQKDLISM